MREIRSFKARELRAETQDGKLYLTGYAALYNSLSEELWPGMRERIAPGAFTRALKEKQDVRHLKNHDSNLVLGRTKAGTTELSEDATGLKFRTLLPDTTYARDLYASVERGDIDESSFGFMTVAQAWIEEPAPESTEDKPVLVTIRELRDVDIFDISTVTYPAYPGTKTAAEASRSLWPDGMPAEVRARFQQRRDDDDAGVCVCECPECVAGDCANCSDEECADANCRCERSGKRDAGACACQCPECLDGDCADCSNGSCDDENCRCEMSARAKVRAKTKKTKRVDGEDLTSDCFLIVGDPQDTGTWKLPVKFSTDEKTKAHLQNALARFNQLKGVSEDDKKAAWQKLVALCKQYGIDVSEENSLRSRLTAEQIWDFEREDAERVRLGIAQVAEVEASL